MPDTAILRGSCSRLNVQEKELSFGHKENIMPVLQRDIIHQSKTIQDYSSNDPLEQLDQIEVVQQSDTTLHYITDEEVSADNNLSCISLTPPIQLLNVFETMSDTKSNTQTNSSNVLLHSPDDASGEKQHYASPSGVEHFDDKSSSGQDEDSHEQSHDVEYLSRWSQAPLLKVPTFELDERLRIMLPQPVINRCSFYSVIHGVNRAVQEMADEDNNGAIEDTQDEGSALIRAVNGPTKASTRRECPNVELAILDEEKFLLVAIENRDEEEMTIRACPATFAEAIGEVEPVVLNDSPFSNGQSENPLSVLASSRTQLWKPSRSWWEAKSGKNPWIEPKNHNKRWRYLWPLIHYHKFLAKCIKKLKRNNIDVKSSMNPVPAFLREEVCAVSDHLAAASKFTSEDWMQGLPNFNGWTDQSEDNQKYLQELIQRIPMRSLTEPADVDSALLRNQIDKCFLKAMASARDQIENGAQAPRNNDESSVPNGKNRMGMVNPNQHFASTANTNRPPRHGVTRGSHSNRSVNGQRMQGGNKSWRNQRGSNRSLYGGYHDQSMMMQPPMQQGYYPPQYNPHYNGYVPNPYLHQSMQSMNNSIYGWNNPYGGNDYSNMNVSMSSEWDQYYIGNQFDPAMEHEASFHYDDSSIANTSIASHNHFEIASQHPSVHSLTHHQENNESTSVQERIPSSSANVSFDEASLNGADVNATIQAMQTPSKNPSAAILGTPSSPSWAHLHHVPGLTTPVTQRGHHMFDASRGVQSNAIGGNAVFGGNPNNWVNAKPLLINHTYNPFPQGRVSSIPPSPATQFTMSPQASSQNNAYRQTSVNFVYPVHNAASHGAQDDGQTLTEETTCTSETASSDTEN